jgi:membrane-associated phospholipid phosphatase
MDMVLGLGRNPTALFQAYLRSSWLDVFTSWMYVSFFVVPSLVAMTLWLRRRGFRDYVAAFAIVHGISLAVHYALPTIPPWMASASGMIEPIERIFLDVMHPSAPQIMDAGYLTSSNDVAAMPSVHMAITTLAALGLARLGKAAAIAGGTYAALMLFSITYLGEHYIIDGVAGIVVAVLAWRVARPVANWMFGNTTQRASRLHAESTSSGFPDPAGQVAE